MHIKAELTNPPTDYTHILKGKLLYGENFHHHVPELIDRIIKLFKLKEKRPSLSQIKNIEKSLSRGSAKILGNPYLFTGLVAFVGEIIIKQLGGNWHVINLKTDPTVWMPYIICQNKTFNPFYPVYRVLYQKDDLDFYERILAEISK